MNYLLSYRHILDEDNIYEIDDALFYQFMMKNLIQDNSMNSIHLLIPVCSYIKLKTWYQFIYHVLLSIGYFSTEVDLVLHQNLIEAFRYAKLIGLSKNPDDLQTYSNQLLYKWIEEQLQFTTPSFRV